MGRLRSGICRCVEPLGEPLYARSGRIVARMCRRCLSMVTGWRPRLHRARVEQAGTDRYVAWCLKTQAETPTLGGLMAIAAPPHLAPHDRALWELDQICRGRHVHA